jgi:small subunit ribosomal protein S17e
MGRIKTSLVKSIAKELYEKYESEFSPDFSKNKEVVKKLVDIKSKKLLNTIVGYITSLKRKSLR